MFLIGVHALMHSMQSQTPFPLPRLLAFVLLFFSLEEFANFSLAISEMSAIDKDGKLSPRGNDDKERDEGEERAAFLPDSWADFLSLLLRVVLHGTAGRRPISRSFNAAAAATVLRITRGGVTRPRPPFLSSVGTIWDPLIRIWIIVLQRILCS